MTSTQAAQLQALYDILKGNYNYELAPLIDSPNGNTSYTVTISGKYLIDYKVIGSSYGYPKINGINCINIINEYRIAASGSTWMYVTVCIENCNVGDIITTAKGMIYRIIN